MSAEVLISNHRDIILLGASAGGVEALIAVARALPVGLEAAVFVVLHVPPTGASVLPRLLGRAGGLPASHATNGETIQRGRIYVAPPDRHLLVRDGNMMLGRGPAENGHRPAVDPLFRSAALAYGPRCIGVVLSGALDDGTAGLAVIKAHGGVTVVQDPAEALYPSMPRSALKHVTIDHVLGTARLGPLLSRLVGEPIAGGRAQVGDHDKEQGLEVGVAADDLGAADELTKLGVPSVFACPDCAGVLWEVRDHALLRYRCRVGHSYLPEGLGAAQSDALEEALWVAIRALKENAALSAQMAMRTRERGLSQLATEYTRRQTEAEDRAKLVESVLRRGRLSATSDTADISPGTQTKTNVDG